MPPHDREPYDLPASSTWRGGIASRLWTCWRTRAGRPTTRSWRCPRWSGSTRRPSGRSSATSPTPTGSLPGCSFDRGRARRCDRYRCGSWLVAHAPCQRRVRIPIQVIETVRRGLERGAVCGGTGGQVVSGRADRRTGFWSPRGTAGRCGWRSAVVAGGEWGVALRRAQLSRRRKGSLGSAGVICTRTSTQ